MYVSNLLPTPEVVIKEERGTVIWAPLLSTDKRLVLKLYRHRGLWHAFRCRVTKFRVEREYERLSQLALWGIPCTAPSDWTHGYSRKYGFYEMLATVMVPDAENLESRLEHGQSCNLRPLFTTVRRMHERGFCHNALFARNILIADSATTDDVFTISDVPRSRIFPQSVVGTRLALLDVAGLASDLMRLGVREEAVPYDAYGLTSTEAKRLSRMLEGYAQNKLRRLARDAESRIKHFLACCVSMLTTQSRQSRVGPRQAVDCKPNLGQPGYIFSLNRRISRSKQTV